MDNRKCMDNPLDMRALANPGIKDLRVYVPGKTIEEVKQKYGLSHIIKLASNENPFGMSKLALQAIQSNAINLALYPDPVANALKAKLSEKYGVGLDQITLGNGSDEILSIIFRTFINAEHEVILSQYGFAAFNVLANANNVKIVMVKENHYNIDLPGILAHITPKTKAIFIANPNNPTGTWLQKKPLLDFLKAVPKEVLVVLDEAYAEFVTDKEYPDSFSWVLDIPNLLVTRTFSKVYGLAGLRVGFAIANKSATDLMNRVRQPFNVNTLAQIAAIAALDDVEHVAKTLENNKKGLIQWEEALQKMSLDFIPSICNFITVDIGCDTDDVFQKMLAQGVIVRPLKPYQLPNHLRISIGTERENTLAISALKNALL